LQPSFPMEERINKPRVFLSHSSRDSVFVDRLYADLLKCQIQPWKYDFEVRHGRSWLEFIFEEGLPTCDSVLVYLTEAALASEIVKREMDTALVRTLREKRIAFLPYVSHAALRDSLRSDLQALHCLEWSESNYRELLPQVVAEVWRSYLERTIGDAVLSEKTRRLELELEISQIQQRQAAVFSSTEDAEFEYLRNRMTVPFRVTLRALGNDVPFLVSPLGLTLSLLDQGGFTFSDFELVNWLTQAASVRYGEEGMPSVQFRLERDESSKVYVMVVPKFAACGLIREIEATGSRGRVVTKLQFAEKMYRLAYWLDFNQRRPDPHFLHRDDADEGAKDKGSE